MSMISSIDCVNQPVMLYLKDGSLFKANSFKSKRHFMTELFLITQIDNDKNCLTLMLLRPCGLCCDQNVLTLVDEFITIDTSCLCGYQTIPNICIKECNHPPTRIKDCICGPFTILPGNDETILWQSNLMAEQCGSINLCIDKGKEDLLKLRIYDNNPEEYKTYQLMNQKSYNFPVTDCSAIKILRSNIETKVQGIFEIELQSTIES